jgi:hypothetical protein
MKKELRKERRYALDDYVRRCKPCSVLAKRIGLKLVSEFRQRMKIFIRNKLFLECRVTYCHCNEGRQDVC